MDTSDRVLGYSQNKRGPKSFVFLALKFRAIVSLRYGLRLAYNFDRIGWGMIDGHSSLMIRAVDYYYGICGDHVNKLVPTRTHDQKLKPSLPRNYFCLIKIKKLGMGYDRRSQHIQDKDRHRVPSDVLCREAVAARGF